MDIKTIIKNYDFAKADFAALPNEVFSVNPNSLSASERVILEGIRYQMMISKANGIYQSINYHSIFQTVSAGVTLTVFGFFLLSLTYYANVNLNLGMKFLTDLFA